MAIIQNLNIHDIAGLSPLSHHWVILNNKRDYQHAAPHHFSRRLKGAFYVVDMEQDQGLFKSIKYILGDVEEAYDREMRLDDTDLLVARFPLASTVCWVVAELGDKSYHMELVDMIEHQQHLTPEYIGCLDFSQQQFKVLQFLQHAP